MATHYQSSFAYLSNKTWRLGGKFTVIHWSYALWEEEKKTKHDEINSIIVELDLIGISV